MKKQISSLTLLLLLSVQLISQNSSDALRYSRILYGGTARFQGLGGAYGAVGADFSVVATNPAGLGIFRSSEITISPSGWISNTSSEYNGVASSETKGNFALGDFGIVFSLKPQKTNKAGGFRNFNFAIGLNRQNDFNNNTFMQGPNDKNTYPANHQSSMMTDWVNILNNQYLTYQAVDNNYQFDIGLAHQANLIYLDDTLNRIYANDAKNGGVYQQKMVYTYGSINEFDFSFGTNYNDVLYFGATIGIPFIRYFENSQYQEFKTDMTIPYFRSLTYTQMLQTHGTGINFKAGIIYSPVKWVRIGASIHTPTYYGFMRDNYNSSMIATFDSLNSTPQYSPDGYYDYQMMTPFRAIGSLAFIIGQFGLVSAEYEFVNYDQARFYSSGTNEFTGVNDEIKAKYKIPLNLRFGTEWRIWDFRIRGGFGYSGTPYVNSQSNIGERFSASGGIGYRGRYFFTDLTYVWSQMKKEYYFYDSNLVNPSHNTQTSSTIIGTLGFRF